MNAPKKRPMPKDKTETRVGVFAFLVSDKRKGEDGGNRIVKTKKAERLQVYLLSLDIVGTHVPCLVYAHVYAGV